MLSLSGKWDSVQSHSVASITKKIYLIIRLIYVIFTNKSIIMVFFPRVFILIIRRFCPHDEPVMRRSVYDDFIMKMIICRTQVFQQSPKNISAAMLVMLVCQLDYHGIVVWYIQLTLQKKHTKQFWPTIKVGTVVKMLTQYSIKASHCWVARFDVLPFILLAFLQWAVTLSSRL